MSEKKAYEALSSTSRLEILKLLHKKPLSVDEIAKIVDLQPITVRHHLKSLEDTGFIESYEEKKRTVGRPKVYYQIAKEPTIVGYPKRRYLTLSNFMIKTLQSLIGSKKASALLRRVGKNMGKSVVKNIETKHEITEWSSEAFRDFFIKGYLEEAGGEPEIMEIDKNRIVFRVHNCLFFELAVKMPETMCDVLHDAFHEGVSNAMGGKAKLSRLTCMGHGDIYCEHKCEWRTSRRKTDAR
ncbi:MAG: ArsR family transcriptional regulator [Candidatus Bathyarchaeota archaeon]|nr:MAG: ArsR family transcriptional regulator [Candidatus Bathyarchaeota archaeon]